MLMFNSTTGDLFTKKNLEDMRAAELVCWVVGPRLRGAEAGRCRGGWAVLFQAYVVEGAREFCVWICMCSCSHTHTHADAERPRRVARRVLALRREAGTLAAYRRGDVEPGGVAG